MDAPANHLLDFAGKSRFATVMADPPWRFTNKTGKIAPEHKRLARYTVGREQRLTHCLFSADLAT